MTDRPRNDPFADHPMLAITLPVAVLAAYDEVAGLNDAERQRAATTFAETIASKGDVLLYSGKTAQEKRDCATAYADLARGLAVLAHQPGGVSFGGLHWCVGSNHHGTREQSPCAAEIAREKAASQQSPG